MRKSLAAAAVAAIAIAACTEAKSADAGPSVARNYKVPSFEGIEVAGPFDVQVRTGGQPAVSGQGSAKLMENTIVEVRGTKLSIRLKDRTSWGNLGRNEGKAHFTVIAPVLREAIVAGSGGITVDKVQGADFAGQVAGSGNLSLGSTNVQSLKFLIAGSGDIQPGKGKARAANYEIAGSGDIDASGVQAEDLKASVAGSGSVRGHASRTADIDIMGSGDVELTGGAKCRVKKMGSGNARCS